MVVEMEKAHYFYIAGLIIISIISGILVYRRMRDELRETL